MKKISTPVLNSLVFIQDEQSGEPPDVDGVGCVWRSDSELAVSCLPDSEGDTEIMLLDADETPAAGLKCVFDGTIKTPSGWVSVETLIDNIHFREPAGGMSTRLQVWTDGHQDSSIIAIRIGAGRQPA